MNRPGYIKELIRPYMRRWNFHMYWNCLICFLFFGVFPALITGIAGFRPVQILLYLAAAGLSIYLKIYRFREQPGRRIDRLIKAEGQLVTLADILTNEPDNPYINMLKKKTEAAAAENPPEVVLRADHGRRIGKTLLALVLFAAALNLPGYMRPAALQPGDLLERTSRRLADAAEIEPGLGLIYEELEELREDQSEEDDRNPVFRKEIDELSRKLTEQMRELERNALSELFDEKGEVLADDLEQLALGDMSLPETREFIMDLLSNTGSDSTAGKSLRQAYSDFSEGAGEASLEDRQEKLAKDLMENLDSEGSGFRNELSDIRDALDELAGEAEAEEPSGPLRPDPDGGLNSGTSAPEDELAEKRILSAGSGTDDGSEGPSAFIPYEGEQPEMQLPEGELLEDGEQGVLRLEGDEEFRLERVQSGVLRGEGVREEEIPTESVPEERRDLVKRYFTSIGSDVE